MKEQFVVYLPARRDLSKARLQQTKAVPHKTFDDFDQARKYCDSLGYSSGAFIQRKVSV